MFFFLSPSHNYVVRLHGTSFFERLFRFRAPPKWYNDISRPIALRAILDRSALLFSLFAPTYYIGQWSVGMLKICRGKTFPSLSQSNLLHITTTRNVKVLNLSSIMPSVHLPTNAQMSDDLPTCAQKLCNVRR